MEGQQESDRSTESRGEVSNSRASEIAVENQSGRDAQRPGSAPTTAEAQLPRLSFYGQSERNDGANPATAKETYSNGNPYSFRQALRDSAGEGRILAPFDERNSKVRQHGEKSYIRLGGQQLYVRNSIGQYVETQNESEIERPAQTSRETSEVSKPSNPDLRASTWRSRWLPRR